MKTLVKLILVLLPVLALGQNKPKDRWITFNPEVGASLTGYMNSGSQLKLDGGFLGGMNLRIGKRIWIQPGLHAMQHVVQAGIDSSYTPGTQEVNAWYLNVPVVAGINLVHTNLFMFRVYGGVVHSIFIGGSINNATSISRDDFTKSLNSARVGVGMDIWRFTWNATVDYGFTKVFSTSDVTSLALTGTIGFKFY